MTNKLPVVGKKYRIKNSEMPWDICEIIDIETKGDTDFVNIEYKERFFKQASYEAKIFNECFEELPEDKVEIKPENQSHISESKEKMKQALDIIRNRKKYLEGYNNGFDDCLKEMAERFSDQISETSLIPSNSRELSPEVKEAMEELKEYLKDYNHSKSYGWLTSCDLLDLEEKTQSLLNALDKQFMSKEEVKIDTSSESCLSDNEMKPNENGSFKHLDNAEELSQDIMKKSAEESIWNPVSELPEDGCEKLLIKLNGTVQIANHTFYDDDGIDELYVTDGWGEDKIECTKFSSEEVESFCTLTDFIKDYEKLKERDKIKEIKLRDLEERVRKLEGK